MAAGRAGRDASFSADSSDRSLVKPEEVNCAPQYQSMFVLTSPVVVFHRRTRPESDRPLVISSDPQSVPLARSLARSLLILPARRPGFAPARPRLETPLARPSRRPMPRGGRGDDAEIRTQGPSESLCFIESSPAVVHARLPPCSLQYLGPFCPLAGRCGQRGQRGQVAGRLKCLTQ